MQFRQMTEEDVAYVADHSISRGVFSKQPEETDFAYTLECDGQVLGVGGMRLITPTVAWGYVDLTHHAGEHIKTCFRVIKEYMEVMCKTHGIHRLQAYVDCEFPEAIRMIEHLGFMRESVMYGFIGEGDAYMYVRIMK